MGHVAADITNARALQQPEWGNPSQVAHVRAILSSCAPLVDIADVDTLRSLLSGVAAGEVLVLQAGDCAEDPAECTAEHVRSKSAVLDLLAIALKLVTCKPVLRVGRIAGQFAKPRSSPVERVGDLELPVYRGHMINRPDPDPKSRRPDPLRILTGYMTASEVITHLGWRGSAGRGAFPLQEPLAWTSHEALLLDYEVPMIRESGDGRRWLGSTHWPWIGERTRQADGAHVAMLSEVVNPVSCKVGPGMRTDEILALCDRLDPGHEPGRLTFIVRMGADVVAERLPVLVETVRIAGHPVIWLSDPMHGNTVVTTDGTKIRLLETIEREIRDFRQAVTAAGGTAGGLHLETTPHDVTECVADASELGSVGRQTSLCDPRLNPRQAVSVVSAWSDSNWTVAAYPPAPWPEKS